MSKYTIKNAILDLGFVDGYCYSGNFPNDWGMLEALFDVIDRIKDRLVDGKLAGDETLNVAYARLLHDIGWIRGILWMLPIPNAISEAMSRLIVFVSEDEEFPWTLLDGHESTAEAKDHQLSGNQRDIILTTGENGGDADTAEFATAIGAAHLGVLSYWRKLGVFTAEDVEEKIKTVTMPVNTVPEPAGLAGRSEPASQAVKKAEEPEEEMVHPFNPSGLRGRRSWTPEQGAAQAERAKGRKKPPYDNDLPAVKADFDAGMSTGKIGKKWGCSDGHIRNFLMKHGIDPRRGRSRDRTISEQVEESYEQTAAKRIEQIGTLAGQGWTDQRIAEEIGHTTGYVNQIRNANGIPSGTQQKKQASEEASSDANEAVPDTSPAARWSPNPIDAEEWMDIQQMLADGRSREAIASDYDVPVEDLNAFIEERLAERRSRTKEPPPGESATLSPNLKGAA